MRSENRPNLMPMKFNSKSHIFTLSNGRTVTEQDAARYRDGFFLTPERAARAMDAEVIGWTNISADASGKIIGLPPHPESPIALEEVP